MTNARINTSQARELAVAFASDITAYIKQHEAEYLAYLERTGQTDSVYRPHSGGAAGFDVRKGVSNG